MASSPGPATPQETPRRIATTGRSFTLPAKASTPTKSPATGPEIGSSEGIETLYHHPNAKLVKFTASARPGGAKIPWESPTESTIAAGELRIYRVPGSVSFLSSGSVLHTIMARSNCWCVDGVSKFVLRILMDTYYRIELPGSTEEDLEQVEKFKVTLLKVCFYEKTPCPFARTFSVDLPEEVEVIKKGKRRKSTGPAKKWKLDRVWRPEGWTEPEKVSEESASGSGSPTGSDDESDGATTPLEQETAEEVKPITPTTPMRQRALAALRSASAPQSPAPISTPPSRLRTRMDVDGTIEVTEPVTSDSSERETPRLRTFQAIPTDMPPSPPDSSAGLEPHEVRERPAIDPGGETTSTGTALDTEAQAQTISVPIEQHVEYYDGISSPPIARPVDDAEPVTTHQHQASTETGSRTVPEVERIPETSMQLPDTHSADEVARQVESLELNLPTQSTAVGNTPYDSPTTEDPVDQAPKSTDDFAPEQFTDIRLPQDLVVEPETQPEAVQEADESIVISPKKVDFVLEDDEESSHLQSSPTLQEPVELMNSQDILPEESRPPTAPEEDIDNRPITPPNPPTSSSSAEDPYAAIQARIMARRSLSGTISFHPGYKSPTRQSTSSTSSTATISSTRSALSRRSGSSKEQQAFASAMVKKAYNAFLGPPAHLVAIMLRIASRFANGAFGVDSMFYVETPAGTPRRPPGSYRLEADYVEESDEEFEEELEEDDFGVPLNSPVRLASRSDSVGSADVRERVRRGWDVD